MLIAAGINLTPDKSLIAIMVIFLLEYLVLRRFFFQPLNKVMTDREKDVRDAATRHEDALARLKEATLVMESRIGQAKKQGAELRESLKAEAAALRAAEVDRTRREADAIVAKAGEELAAAVAVARQKIDGEAPALARLAVERIVGRAL